MSLVAAVDLVIRAGDTFNKVFRCGIGPMVYRPITMILQRAPALLMVPAHGLVDGWPIAVTNVVGMVEINAASMPPKASDYARVTLIDPDTFELNAVNAGGFSKYKNGGTIQYPTPVDLSGFSAEFLLYVNGNRAVAPVRFTSVAGDIELDNVRKTITLRISSILTALMDWSNATYDFNLINGADVQSIAGGSIALDTGTGSPLVS